MPILIADSNSFRKPALRIFLSESKSNRIALTEEVLVEMHKTNPACTMKNSLSIARGFPEQIVVLRGVAHIHGLPIHSAATARKMIDKRQTADFANWYDDVSNSPYDKEMAEALNRAQNQAKTHIDEIAASVQHIQPIFRKMSKVFTSDELFQMRKRFAYSYDTQKKLIDLTYEMSKALFKKSNVSINLYPERRMHAFRYFIFRYSMCMVLLYTRWVHYGNLSSNPDKLVNHVTDMHLAALGTFFAGVLSDDKLLVDVHREARFLLRSSGMAFLG